MALVQRKLYTLGSFDQRVEIIRSKFRGEFIRGIVMMDPIREPNSFGVNHELFPPGITAVAFVALNDGIKSFTNLQIMPVVLSKDDIAATESSFTKVVDQFLLSR